MGRIGSLSQSIPRPESQNASAAIVMGAVLSLATLGLIIAAARFNKSWNGAIAFGALTSGCLVVGLVVASIVRRESASDIAPVQRSPSSDATTERPQHAPMRLDRDLPELNSVEQLAQGRDCHLINWEWNRQFDIPAHWTQESIDPPTGATLENVCINTAENVDRLRVVARTLREALQRGQLVLIRQNSSAFLQVLTVNFKSSQMQIVAVGPGGAEQKYSMEAGGLIRYRIVIVSNEAPAATSEVS